MQYGWDLSGRDFMAVGSERELRAGPNVATASLPNGQGAPSSPGSMLCFILLGALLGTMGQIARSAVGLKKEMDEAAMNHVHWRDWFNVVQLLISLMLGAAAGAFSAILLLGEALDKKISARLCCGRLCGVGFY